METPKHLISAELPDNFVSVRMAITTLRKRQVPTLKSPGSRLETKRIVEGFEDVIDEPVGAGLFYNTGGSIDQLAFALSISSNPSVKDGFEKPADEAIDSYKKRRVLEGMKILDLGCGQYPSFALVSKALGAEVYTADAEDLKPEMQDQLDGHAVVDFNDSGAASKIQEVTAGDLDMITENMIGMVPGHAQVTMPTLDTMESIADPLLKTGGYAFYLTTGAPEAIFQKS